MIDLAALDARIAAIVEKCTQRPEYVSQRTVLAVVGIEPRDYLHHARNGAFPSAKVRRVVLARTTDVIAWLDGRVRRARVKPAKALSPRDAALARVGARRVG